MARQGTYYIRMDTFWQNSPDRWVGPFDSRDEADAAIEAAREEPGALIALPGVAAPDVRHAVRVYGVHPRSTAQRMGMRAYALGDARDNTLSRLPINADELFDIEQDADPLPAA